MAWYWDTHMAVGVLGSARCSSARQAAQHSFPTFVGEYFRHKALGVGIVSVTDFFCCCLGMGGEEKCDWQEGSAFKAVRGLVVFKTEQNCKY